jgi:putative spermidine/putrescine transport system permease protein
MRRAFAAANLLSLVVLIAPVFFVVLSSFGESVSLAFPPPAWGVDAYKQIKPEYWTAVGLSLFIATVSSAAAGVLGGGIGLALCRWRGRFYWMAVGICLAPLVVPAMVTAVAIVEMSGVLFEIFGWALAGGVLGIVCGHVLLGIPFVIRGVIAAHSKMDYALEEAALSLGASPWQSFWLVTFAVVRPGIAVGMIFTFLLSFDDIPMALILGAGRIQTLPIKLFTTIEYSYSIELMAVAAILVYAFVVLIGVLEWAFGLRRLFEFSRADT